MLNLLIVIYILFYKQDILNCRFDITSNIANNQIIRKNIVLSIKYCSIRDSILHKSVVRNNRKHCYRNTADNIGNPEPADRILMEMLSRQEKGLFQNGVWGQSGKGIEWTTWNDEPSGADGYLADNFRFLQAVFLRTKDNRARLYRPLFDNETR